MTLNEPTASVSVFLEEAEKLNSDLGRHVKNCSFSTNLTGRFYQNSSMQIHKAKSRQAQKLKAKRKKLERSIALENEKIRILEETLRERQRLRREEEEWQIRSNNAAIEIQRKTRQMISMRKVELMRVELGIQNYIVLFLQSLFRGWKDRKRVEEMKLQIIKTRLLQHRKEELASIKIQSIARRMTSRIDWERRYQAWESVKCKAAIRIQSYHRGCGGRILFEKESRLRKEKNAAILLQSLYRGMVGRQITESKRIDRRNKKKAKARIPLHLRRYSTYAMDNTRRQSTSSTSQRRFSELSTGVLKNTERRRSSLSGIEVVKMIQVKKASDRSEVGSLASTELDSDTSTIDSNTKASKLELARKRAAARSAKLQRSMKIEKENKPTNNTKVKNKVNSDESVESVQKPQKMVTKQRIEKKAEHNPVQSGGQSALHEELEDDPVGTNKNRLLGKSSQTKDSENPIIEPQHNAESDNNDIRKPESDFAFSFDSAFDDNFEDDFRENEDDLG